MAYAAEGSATLKSPTIQSEIEGFDPVIDRLEKGDYPGLDIDFASAFGALLGLALCFLSYFWMVGTASARGLVTLPPAIASGDLIFAAPSVLVRGEQSYAKPSFMHLFENIGVFDIAPQKQRRRKQIGELVSVENTLLSGSERNVGRDTLAIGIDRDIAHRRCNGELPINFLQESSSAPAIVDKKFCCDFERIGSVGVPPAWWGFPCRYDFSRPDAEIGTLQIENANLGDFDLIFGERDLRLGRFGGGLSCCGGGTRVLYASAHVTQLNKEQSGLTYANENQEERYERNSRIGMPPIGILGVGAALLLIVTSLTFLMVRWFLR